MGLGESWIGLENSCYSWFGKPEQTYLRDLANRKSSRASNESRWHRDRWRMKQKQDRQKECQCPCKTTAKTANKQLS